MKQPQIIVFSFTREVNLTDEINEATQRNNIRNIRATLQDPENISIRSELVWAAAMAENGILKIGKATKVWGIDPEGRSETELAEELLGILLECRNRNPDEIALSAINMFSGGEHFCYNNEQSKKEEGR